MREKYQRVHRLAELPSEIEVSLTVRYARGTLVSERYDMSDRNGVSTVTYRAVARTGAATRIQSVPAARYDVAAFFEGLVRDGIWELSDAPPRGDTSARYTVRVAQRADGGQGDRVIRFTDPTYWATTAGRRYRIRLEKDKPTPDLLSLQSVSNAEPRYGRIVAAFRAFGSDAFHAKVAAARAYPGATPAPSPHA